MLKCIINEIIEEWKIYYNNVTKRELFKKVKRALYTNYLDKHRINNLRTRRKCSLRTLGAEDDNIKKNHKVDYSKKNNIMKKPLKKEKKFESIRIKKVKCADKAINKNDALDIIMGSPLFSENLQLKEDIDVDKENINEMPNIIENKIIGLEKKIANNDKSNLNEDKEVLLPEKPKLKKIVRSKKNPIVLKRNTKKNVKTNISMYDISEKLEFIKLGRSSLSKKEETLNDKKKSVNIDDDKKKSVNIVDDEKNSLNIANDNPSKVLEVNNQINITDNLLKEIDKQSQNKSTDICKITEITKQPEERNEISKVVVNNPLKLKNIKKENEILKKLFKKEKAKIEYKRNSVFLENRKEDLDVDRIIKQVFKKDKIIKTPIKQDFTTKIDMKPRIETKQPLEVKKIVSSDIKNSNDIKIEETCKIDTSKLKRISHVFNENSKIYDVKSSKYIRDSPRSKNDLYRKVIDNQRKGISQNEYKSSTIIPHIKSDDEDSLVFIEPEFSKNNNINEKVRIQNHDVLEEYFNICEDINVEEIFPNIKDISNDSPNKWM